MSATPAEVASLLPHLVALDRHQVDVVTTGVGMVATAARCARALAQTPYDLALNLGVCGSFDTALALGDVVHVVRDTMPELGAEDGDRFLTLGELGLVDEGAGPLLDGDLVNAAPPANAVLAALPPVRGITVNTVHGNPQSIAAIVERLDPQVESMEGAAFMYACLLAGVAFAQVRAVSNRVERRHRSSWRIEEALANLTGTAGALLESL